MYVATRFPFGRGVTQGSWYFRKNEKRQLWVWPTIIGCVERALNIAIIVHGVTSMYRLIPGIILCRWFGYTNYSLLAKWRIVHVCVELQQAVLVVDWFNVCKCRWDNGGSSTSCVCVKNKWKRVLVCTAAHISLAWRRFFVACLVAG